MPTIDRVSASLQDTADTAFYFEHGGKVDFALDGLVRSVL